MSDYPLISIVIPFFNRESTLKYCVNSILNQEYENWELIIIDDCSKDNSLQIANNNASREKRIKVLKRSEEHTF